MKLARARVGGTTGQNEGPGKSVPLSMGVMLVSYIFLFCKSSPRGTSHRGAAREWSEVRRLFPGEERRGLAAEGAGPSPVGKGAGGA